MMYVAPEFKKTAFNCPYCHAYASMSWSQLSRAINQLLHVLQSKPNLEATPIHACCCTHCHKYSYWFSEGTSVVPKAGTGKMIIPQQTIAPFPHPDMPDSVKKDYEEAREICSSSHRGAAALLRLAIQNLCKELGERGKNINDDIGSLVKKGLPVEIQQALDIIRVVGNNAVHPGELNSDDVYEAAISLFSLINAIVEERISKPRKLRELFEKLPEGARNSIEKRDSELRGKIEIGEPIP